MPSTFYVEPLALPPVSPSGFPANVIDYIGEPDIPSDIRRRRLYVQQTMKRLGTPCLIKHMYNAADVEEGIAEKSPYYDDVYGQTRHNDPVSHGIGYVSVEKSDNEWISPEGAIVVSADSPGANYVRAPRFRGFGPGYLTYVILPDVAEDFFKLDPTGALIRIQTARAKMGWFPEANDNDLLILCEIDKEGTITTVEERYQLKQTTPTTIRGLDRRGRRGQETMDFGNQHRVNQTFELTLIPPNDELYNVETDR